MVSRDFKDIRVSEFVQLASFEPEGLLSGVRLQCTPGEQRRSSFFVPARNTNIMFCEDDCDRRPIPGARGPKTSLECANYIDTFIRECVEAMGCIDNVQFCGVGGHAKRYKNTGRKNKSPSRHSTGDALDLFGVKCTRRGPGGVGRQNFNLELSSKGRARNTKEYDAFLACWRDKMEKSRPRARGHKGAIACQGAEKPNNALHNDHIHLSCPTPRRRTGGT